MSKEYNERNMLYLAGSTIALTIIAVIVFAYSGGSYLFYTIAIITIIIGFYMSYYGSKSKVVAKQKPKKRR